MGFERTLKSMLVGNPEARFAYINNIEVEEHWSGREAEVHLPSLTSDASKIIVNRMEELGLFLTTQQDTILLKAPVDPDYWEYVGELGFERPQILSPSLDIPTLNITQNFLQTPEDGEKLAALRDRIDYLMPFGDSRHEEELSRRSGIPLSVPSAETFERVNSKIYGRALNTELGLNQIRGASCRSLPELSASFAEMAELVDGGKRLVIKEAFGVSGKGLSVVDSRKKFEQVTKLMLRKAQSLGSQALSVVIEEWIDKQFDFNYQFLISRSGEVRFCFVKEAITDNGVHQGHILPARFTEAEVESLAAAAQQIGRVLYRDGYWGVVGVDGIKALDGKIYPILEINARFNMSTYQSVIQERFIDNAGKVGLAKHFGLKLPRPIRFAEVRSALEGLLFSRSTPRGLLINAFATVNAASVQSRDSFLGRLYGVIIAESRNEAEATSVAAQNALLNLQQRIGT